MSGESASTVDMDATLADARLHQLAVQMRKSRRTYRASGPAIEFAGQQDRQQCTSGTVANDQFEDHHPVSDGLAEANVVCDEQVTLGIWTARTTGSSW